MGEKTQPCFTDIEVVDGCRRSSDSFKKIDYFCTFLAKFSKISPYPVDVQKRVKHLNPGDSIEGFTEVDKASV